MRVAVISKADSFGGGAGRVAQDLVKLINGDGHLAIHWVSWTKLGYTPTRRRLYGELWHDRFSRWVHFARKWFVPDLIPFELPNLYLQNLPEHFDVVHFHDLTSAISPLTVAWFAKRMPTVWTLHDTSPFTGGCLNPLGCERFRRACGSCPMHGSEPLKSWRDFSAITRWVNGRVHRRPILRVVPSAWLADMAVSSGAVPERPLRIPNGIDLGVFKPAADKAALRRELGLPVDRKIVLFASGILRSFLKGIPDALRALHAVDDLKPFVLLVGQGHPKLAPDLIGLDYHETGYIGDQAMLARLYSAADILLYPTLADSQSLVVTEAMACGVPVVGYATGGVPELVEQGGGGQLVPTRDEAALQRALRYALTEADLAEWGRRAVAHIHQNYTRDGMLASYMAAYEAAIAGYGKSGTPS